MRDNGRRRPVGAGKPWESTMPYSLPEFCDDCRAIVRASPRIEEGLARIAEQLRRLLLDPAFVAATFDEGMAPGKRLLHRDPETDMHVLAHVQPASQGGAPHSHGASWAVYGNARGLTQMTEWRRVNPEREDHAVLEPAARYSLGPGQSRAYGPEVIHSTAHPEQAWVIRVTGTDLDRLPRYRFRPQRDSIVENAGGQKFGAASTPTRRLELQPVHFAFS
jgi:hypothetical protein